MRKNNTMSEQEQLNLLAHEYNQVRKGSPKTVEQDPDPYDVAMSNLMSEGVAPILHGASTAALGIPKALVREYGPDYAYDAIFPEQKTMLGKTARFVAEGTGLIKGGALALGRGGANRIVGEAVNLSRGGKIGRAAVEGAITGFLQTPEEDSIIGSIVQQEGNKLFALKERAAQGLIGATLDTFMTAVGEGAGLIKSKVTDFRGGAKAASMLDEATSEIDRLKTVKSEKLTDITSRARLAKEKLALTKANFVDGYKKALAKSADDASLYVQNNFMPMMREAGEVYGRELDSISDAILKSKSKPLTRKAARNLFEQTLNEVQAEMIPEGPVTDAFKKLIEKYSIVSEISQKTGKIKALKPDVPLKELIEDIKRVRNLVAQSKLSGQQLFQAGDVPVAIMNKNYGELLDTLGTQGAKLKALNAEYAPVLQTKKAANKLFRPMAGEESTKTAEMFFRRLGKAEVFGAEPITGAEVRTLGKIKEGSRFAKGIGEVDKPIKDLTKHYNTRMSQLEARGLRISRAERNAATKIAREIDDAIAAKKITRDQAKAALANAESAKKFLITLGGIAAGTAATYIGGKKGLRVLRGLVE